MVQSLNKECPILAGLGAEERSASSMRGYGPDPFGSMLGSGEQPKIVLGGQCQAERHNERSCAIMSRT